MSGSILILGATSAIARATAEAFAARGLPLYLAGRDVEELEHLAQDLKIRFETTARFGYFDAEDYDSHKDFLARVLEQVGTLEGVLVAFGYLGEMQDEARRQMEARAIIERNLAGAVSILELCAGYFEKEKREGFIICLSSVAGDRGRQSNYLYGAAKGGLSIYLQGLRNRLYNAGVRVITVKPGFVDTAMTFGMQGLFLVASPRYVAERIARAVDRRRDVIYVPWFWRYIMLVIKLIPETIFKRLKL